MSQPLLEIGTVIRSYDESTTPPKVKYWVVAGVSGDGLALASVYINTRVHPFIMRKPELLNAQYRLDRDSRQLVDYTCFADCSQIRVKNLADIELLLSRKPHYIKGYLYPEEIDDMMRLIRECPNVSEQLKKDFGFQ
jgi:hypothetical protein